MVENRDGQTVQAHVHAKRGQGLQNLTERQVAHEDTLGAGVGETHRFVVGYHLDAHVDNGVKIVVEGARGVGRGECLQTSTDVIHRRPVRGTATHGDAMQHQTFARGCCGADAIGNDHRG